MRACLIGLIESSRGKLEWKDVPDSQQTFCHFGHGHEGVGPTDTFSKWSVFSPMAVDSSWGNLCVCRKCNAIH
jgi:hypothetical protein